MLVKRLLIVLTALTFSLPISAGEEQPPRFAIETAIEARAGCKLLAFDGEGTMRVEQAGATLTLPRFLALRQDASLLPAIPMRNFVLLTNGDRVPLDPDAAASQEDSRLHVWPAPTLPDALAKGLPLFLPNVVLLFWSLPDGVDDADLFIAKLEREARKRDVVHLKNGDRVEGTVTGIGGKFGCKLKTDRQLLEISWSKLAGIAWNTDRQARLRIRKTYFRATIHGGARINFTELRFEGKSRRWLGKPQFGPTLELPESSILALEVRQGQAVDLSELTPTRYEHRPYLGVAWPLRNDAAVTGHPLQLGGSFFEKGLGMHGPCQVTYKLDGQYDRLEGLVGIDELRARRGRARLAVMLDGKRVELGDGKERTSRDAPLPVRLDLRNVRELTLIVELGSFGDVQAQVNWVNPRLIKRE